MKQLLFALALSVFLQNAAMAEFVFQNVVEGPESGNALGEYILDSKDSRLLVSSLEYRIGTSTEIRYHLKEYDVNTGLYTDLVSELNYWGSGWLWEGILGYSAKYGKEGELYFNNAVRRDGQETATFYKYNDTVIELPVGGRILGVGTSSILVDTYRNLSLVTRNGSLDSPVFTVNEVYAYPSGDDSYHYHAELIGTDIYYSKEISGSKSIVKVSNNIEEVVANGLDYFQFTVSDVNSDIYYLKQNEDLTTVALIKLEESGRIDNVVTLERRNSLMSFIEYEDENIVITDFEPSSNDEQIHSAITVYNEKYKSTSVVESLDEINALQPYLSTFIDDQMFVTRGYASPDTDQGMEFEIAAFSYNSYGNEITVRPQDDVIDPYDFQVSQFSIDVIGTNIYGLDVKCNLSSSSLSLTQANYNALFGSKNSMTLPLFYDTASLAGAETLIAPEAAFTGSGSFVLADVIAEFTTEDIEITCAAEVSDENGRLLQVALTPATIRIDDGVHGGTGSVSGVIEIPGVSDLSGVEVVLSIDGRQVTVTTDESGRFEFDGLRDGEFTISLASDNYVQSCQAANVTEGGAVELGSIELLAGDINADGNIDIADFTFMAARYRSNQGDADYDAKADLNRDGTINIQDLAILGSHFGSTQCNL